MLEGLFYSDNMLMNILVIMNLYPGYFAALFVPATYYIFLKIFTFPLITRKSHEFVIMASPESVKIKKITSRILPFFNFRKGLYWFSESSEEENGYNKYSIYLEGINQPITEVTRNNNKVHDLTHAYKIPRQVSTHKIVLPTRIKEHLNRHFKLTLNAQTGKIRLEPTSERQPLRVSFYHTLGIVIETLETVPQEIELGGGTNTKQIQLTTQLMMQQLKATSETSNFSSSYAYETFREHVGANQNIVGNLSGAMDPKIIVLLLALMGIGGAAFFMMYYSNPTNVLGPIPKMILGF